MHKGVEALHRFV